MSRKKVMNRFAELLAAKARREGKRKISLVQVMADTGLPRDTIYGYNSNTITRYDRATVNALCEYLECEPGDLLVREEVEDGISPLEALPT